jgi:hypothetical protein
MGCGMQGKAEHILGSNDHDASYIAHDESASD